MSKKRSKKKAGHKAKKLTGTPGHAPVSLCMIVKNEERFLEDCLRSVADLVSEIVIVDTGSTDRTIEIAKTHGARLFEIEWEGDFAKARNYGLKHATQPWILYLDADERLHPPFHPLVKQAISSTNIDAFYVRVSSEVGEMLGSMPHVQAYPRLFRRKPGVYFTGRIHEQITPAIRQINGQFGLLDVEIEHLGYNLTQDEMVAKVKRNLESLKEQVADEPQNAYARFQLGQTLIIAGEIKSGKEQLHKALEIKGLSEGLEATIILILANDDYTNKLLYEAIEKIQKALQLAPSQRLGYFLLSECYALQENYQQAIAALESYWQYADNPFSDVSVDKVILPHLIYQRQATYHFHLEHFDICIPHYINYFESAPNYRSNALQRLIYAASQTGQQQTITATLNAIIPKIAQFDDPLAATQSLLQPALNGEITIDFHQLIQFATDYFPDEGVFAYYRGNFYLENQAFENAEMWFNRAIEKSPETFEIHHNLAVTLIKQQKYQQAIDCFEYIAGNFPEKRELALRRLAGLHMKTGNTEMATRFMIAANETANSASSKK